jgi:hypothetical protein
LRKRHEIFIFLRYDANVRLFFGRIYRIMTTPTATPLDRLNTLLEQGEDTTRRKRHRMIGGTLLVSGSAFAAGFGDCAFQTDKAKACVAHAASLIGNFQAVGQSLIDWMIAIGRAVF